MLALFQQRTNHLLHLLFVVLDRLGCVTIRLLLMGHLEDAIRNHGTRIHRAIARLTVAVVATTTITLIIVVVCVLIVHVRVIAHVVLVVSVVVVLLLAVVVIVIVALIVCLYLVVIVSLRVIESARLRVLSRRLRRISGRIRRIVRQLSIERPEEAPEAGLNVRTATPLITLHRGWVHFHEDLVREWMTAIYLKQRLEQGLVQMRHVIKLEN